MTTLDEQVRALAAGTGQLVSALNLTIAAVRQKADDAQESALSALLPESPKPIVVAATAPETIDLSALPAARVGAWQLYEFDDVVVRAEYDGTTWTEMSRVVAVSVVADKANGEKELRDAAISSAIEIVSEAIEGKLSLAGGTLTGDLLLGEMGLDNASAVSKLYADSIGEYELFRRFDVIGNYDIDTGTGSDASTNLQSLVTYCDDNLIPSLHVPTATKNYLIGTPVVIREPGIRIHGDRGGTYMRGNKKNGSIVIGATATHGLELISLEPTDPHDNPADMLNISGLGFIQADGVAAKTKIGIVIDRQNDGPDRGYVFERLSGKGLHAVIHQPAKRTGIYLASANWYINGGCMSENAYAVYSESPVGGLVFTNMQAEQNTIGCIHGDFQSGVVIENNMLEGQPNVVNLAATKSGIYLSFKNNYLEANTVFRSEYVVQLSCIDIGLMSSATVGPNWLAFATMPIGYFTITGQGKWEVHMNDPYPVTFKLWAGSILRGSKLFHRDIDYFRLGGMLTGVKTPEICLGANVPMDTSGGTLLSVAVTSGGTGYTDAQIVTLNSNDNSGYGASGTASVTAGVITSITVASAGYGYSTGDVISVDGGDALCRATATDGEWTHVKFSSGMKVTTPFGSLMARNAQEVTPIPLAATTGDLVVITALVMVKDLSVGPMFLYMTDSTGAYAQSQGPSDAHLISGGEWVVICMPFIMGAIQPSLGYKYEAVIEGATVKAYCAGACAKNYGAYSNDGTQFIDIKPVMPRV